MKLYKKIDTGITYSIEQIDYSGTITQHPKSGFWYAIPYNNTKEDIIEIGKEKNLNNFKEI